METITANSNGRNREHPAYRAQAAHTMETAMGTDDRLASRLANVRLVKAEK